MYYNLKKNLVYFILCILLLFAVFLVYVELTKHTNAETAAPIDEIETATYVQETEEITEPSTIPVTEPELDTDNDITIELKNIPLLYSGVEYSVPITKADVIVQLELVTDFIECVKAEYYSNTYTAEATAEMEYEISRLQSIASQLQADLNRRLMWETEYPYATNVWYFLRSNGYNEAVTAGIIGNMMIETSGGTLKLNPTIYNSTRAFYGLCQWSLYYRPEVADMTFEEQLDYLDKYMYKEFDTFGFCYKTGFTYDDFLALEDPADAALAFAKVYERCGSGSYGLRQTAAKTAYEYFATTVN